MVHPDIWSGVGDRAERHNFNSIAQREHFITRQDIRNISKSVVDMSAVNHADDAQSVVAIVKKLANEQYNPVLLHKPFGVKDENFPELPEDSFMLVIQTEHEKELFEKFSSGVVCVDSTHNTNQYNYKLITLMIRDNHGQGKDILATQSVVEEIFLILKSFAILHRSHSSLGNKQQGRSPLHVPGL